MISRKNTLTNLCLAPLIKGHRQTADATEHCLLTEFQNKIKQVAQRATIAHLSPMCPVNLPQNLMQPFPYPNDATHKIWSRLTNWLQRYSSSKVWKFCHSRASNSEMSGLIRPKIELDWAFMPVLVTSNFDDDSIKNEQASMETAFSHYKSMGIFLDAQGQLTP